MTQSRTSYLPKEIMWGNRFLNVIVYNRSQHVYEVDYNKFDEVSQVGVGSPTKLKFIFLTF